MSRRLVLYIGGGHDPAKTKHWGGTTATNSAIVKAMAASRVWRLKSRFRADLGPASRRKLIEEAKAADLVHCNDTDILGELFDAGVVPDVIGPITRSPVKDYKGWECPYADRVEDYYSAEVIRLNLAEERGEYVERVTLIRHGVDTDRLRPALNRDRRIVLWAGERSRSAKNFGMWEQIREKLELPDGFRVETMTGYDVQDYWDKLDDTLIVVNTSRYESFCAAIAEAKAKGVVVIHRERLFGPGVMEDSEIQVPYDVDAYVEMVHHLVSEPLLAEVFGMRARNYILARATLAHMREDIEAVYGRAWEKR